MIVHISFAQKRYVFLLTETDCSYYVQSFSWLLAERPAGIEVELWATSKNPAFVQSMVKDRLKLPPSYFSSMKLGVSPEKLALKHLNSLLIWDRPKSKPFQIVYYDAPTFYWPKQSSIWAKERLPVGRRSRLTCGDSLCLLSSYSNYKIFKVRQQDLSVQQLSEASYTQTSKLYIGEMGQEILSAHADGLEPALLIDADAKEYYGLLPELDTADGAKSIVHTGYHFKGDSARADTNLGPYWKVYSCHLKATRWDTTHIKAVQRLPDTCTVFVTDLGTYHHCYPSPKITKGNQSWVLPIGVQGNFFTISTYRNQDYLLAVSQKGKLSVYHITPKGFLLGCRIPLGKTVEAADFATDGSIIFVSSDGYLGKQNVPIGKK